jgi:S-DNA-T family DNA segregation ATPase FtsK/SpoIIIE
LASSEAKREIEKRVVRLGQKARAAGIHLILATQTPRRDIVSGAIRANLPTYVVLRVASGIEARILETPGAELLLGNGDLLFKSIGPPMRLQAALSTAAVIV